MENFSFKNHDYPGELSSGKVQYRLVPAKAPDGSLAKGLYAAWIVLDNPTQYNSYTTEMIKDVILSFRRASNARDVVAVVFTGTGDKAFCTGGNTKEYAEYYATRPEEYAQYMRLFNDMVSTILMCDKPVVCRVNGMRVGGGQEIGMAADFSVASDLASFGQAGPKHGSAPDGGATDFLPLFVGVERAMASCTLCEPWTAYEAQAIGLITDVVPVLKVGDKYVPNPKVITDRWIDNGKMVFGKLKSGKELEEGMRTFERGVVDMSALDRRVDELVTSLLMTMPGCLSKTVQSIRKHKLEKWDQNKETNRAWLALNMMTEANAGFRAFNEGPRGKREVDFIELRRRLAQGETWGPNLLSAVLPRKE
ncbi:MAG: 6-oxocyclohex-1-ene-1-carbonyl-CoA hydratase [Myxococcota bacterium]